MPGAARLAERAGPGWRGDPQAGVAIEVIDVGGGFPVPYPDIEPPALGAYLAEIEAGFERLGRQMRGSGPSRAGRWWPAAHR